MSTPQQPEPHAGPVAVPAPERPPFRWYHKAGAVMAAVFCFELGVFLLLYPWVGEWDGQAAVLPVWAREFWVSPWFRGAVSGLGVVNIYISFIEVFRLKRFAG